MHIGEKMAFLFAKYCMNAIFSVFLVINLSILAFVHVLIIRLLEKKFYGYNL